MYQKLPVSLTVCFARKGKKRIFQSRLFPLSLTLLLSPSLTEKPKNISPQSDLAAATSRRTIPKRLSICNLSVCLPLQPGGLSTSAARVLKVNPNVDVKESNLKTELENKDSQLALDVKGLTLKEISKDGKTIDDLAQTLTFDELAAATGYYIFVGRTRIFKKSAQRRSESPMQSGPFSQVNA